MRVFRLLLVDNHSMLAEGLAMRLSTVSDLWIVGRCTTGDARLSRVLAAASPDVVTVDVEPVGAEAGELVRWLGRQQPTAQVVVLTGQHDARLAVDVARAGALAWVPKRCGVDTLVRVLRTVCLGNAWYPPDLLGVVLRELRADAHRAEQRSGPLDALSDREREVLRRMVQGKRGCQIAEELLISAETVRTHIRSILTKLGVHSQLEAVSAASAAGLRPDEPMFPGSEG